MNDIEVNPITPKEVNEYSNTFPDYVIIGTNECIKDHYSHINKESLFKQDTLIEYILRHAPEGVDRNTLFNNHWLDIEDKYRGAGWDVSYRKPAYYEVGVPATFKFTPKL